MTPVDHTICYLNTDLDLRSGVDLTELIGAFETAGVFSLYGATGEEGDWHASFETQKQHTEPESNIAEMLNVVESLSSPLRAVWDRCELREFNIGYDCGDEPWAFNQGLSPALLGRMSAAGAALRITIYPDRKSRVPDQAAQTPGTD